MAGLLDGMRVLDLSVWRPMPHATQILADLGAEVLKIEPPGGDPMRSYPELFASVARGKRSAVVNLKDRADRARLLHLAAQADVLCEGWRPGVADRLGVGYEAVRTENPSVIYCSLSGFGQEGPMRDAPGHDLNFQALAGALAPRDATDAPQIPRLPVADLEGGSVCALIICAAWARKVATGVGERIDVSMTDCVAWWAGTRTRTLHASGDDGMGASPGYGVFRTLDGGWLALGALSEQRLWKAICDALELSGLGGLDWETRLRRADELNATIARKLARMDRDTALTRLREHGAPATPVLTSEEAAEHPQRSARKVQVMTRLGPVIALPAHLGRSAPLIPADIPEVNQHPEGFSRIS